MEENVEVIENEIIESRMKDIELQRAQMKEIFAKLSKEEQIEYMKSIYANNNNIINELELNTIDEDGEVE